MLKIVPDPPIPSPICTLLETTLLRLIEHLDCALAITHQSTFLSAGPSADAFALTTTYELESAHALAEQALGTVQLCH